MAKKNAFKKQKYEDRLVTEINLYLRSTIRDARLQFVSITKVEMSSDYSSAKIYWDTFDANLKKGAMEAFEGLAGKIRSHLAGLLNVRHTPTLSFFYDSQFEDEQKIVSLLNKDKSQNNK